MVGVVTAHARNRAVSGPALVPEELLAERNLLGCQWIVVRNICGVLLEAQLQRHLVLGALTYRGGDQDRQENDRRPRRRGRGRPRPPTVRRRASVGYACLRWGRRPCSPRTAGSRRRSPGPVAVAPSRPGARVRPLR